MIWVDRKNKRCRSAEDWNFFPGEDGWMMKYAELKTAHVSPVTAIGAYTRSISFLDYHTFGQFYVVGMGYLSTKEGGGIRKTYPNAFN